mmetsp:Transcript_3764/g.14846  ORF Transcript_3764/g.14846 Transcript_3764/m.14846 type:complete len:109 (+) Transcript_3764:1917-2243(+)
MGVGEGVSHPPGAKEREEARNGTAIEGTDWRGRTTSADTLLLLHPKTTTTTLVSQGRQRYYLPETTRWLRGCRRPEENPRGRAGGRTTGCWSTGAHRRDAPTDTKRRS